jgi:hypothetical protein
MAAKNYILKWRHGISPEIRWFLRGIRGDGSFYGEVLSTSDLLSDVDAQPISGKGVNIDGRLSTTDNLRFRELAASFRNYRFNTPNGWTGLLAEGLVSAPTMLYYHASDDRVESDEAVRFMQIVRLFEPYVRAHYSEVT